jgi:hypothetical protein
MYCTVPSHLTISSHCIRRNAVPREPQTADT